MDNEELYIRTWYQRLCAEQRQAELNADNTTCDHCGRTRKEHHYAERKCSLYATSTTYRAVNADEVNRLSCKIVALEQLAEICNWKLAG